ncbi:MAG: VanZ family protein [Armatimonadota bacterium]
MTESGKILKNRIWRWGPVAFWMVLIFFLSAQSKLPELPGLAELDYGDKIVHAFAYAILACLIWRALERGLPKMRRIAIAIAAATVYGLSDELHQLYVPGRCFDLLDLGADALGAAIAAVALTIRMGGYELGARTTRLRSKGQEESEP